MISVITREGLISEGAAAAAAAQLVFLCFCFEWRA